MTNELVQMAEASRFPMISYLLGMAYAEAFDALRGARPAKHAQFGGNPLRSKVHAKDNRALPGRAAPPPIRPWRSPAAVMPPGN